MTAQPLDAPRGFVRADEHYRALARIDALEAELAEARALLNEQAAADEMARLKLRMPQLSPRECQMLLLVAAASPRVVTHERLAELIVSERSINPFSVVCTYACRIARATKAAGCPVRPLQPVYSVGYVMPEAVRDWLRGILATRQPSTGETAPTATQCATNGKSKRGGSR